jgi:hypothetical protein
VASAIEEALELVASLEDETAVLEEALLEEATALEELELAALDVAALDEVALDVVGVDEETAGEEAGVVEPQPAKSIATGRIQSRFLFFIMTSRQP